MALLACGVAARRLGVAPPVLLLACGALLGLVPALRAVHLPPEVMLLVFLPALLYWESLTTSLREIRSNLRLIVLMSTGLVIVTAAGVAVVVHLLGMPWGPAWVLGAAVAPTDATAIAVLARVLPHRLVTVLRAESLVNDGTALVIYGIAVGITVGQQRLSPAHVFGLFVLAYAGGAAAGLLTAWLTLHVRRLFDDPLLENVVSLLTPFSAFLLAELIHASGVLAVVVCGLTLSQTGPLSIRADSRQQVFAFWGLSTFVLNAALFVLVGLQLQTSVRELASVTMPRALAIVGIVSTVIIGVRIAWMFTTPYLPRILDRRAQQRLRRIGARPRAVIAIAGLRGAVSLAAALAVPERLASGAPFPGRDMIVFVTSGVIVITLVLQGLALPLVVRWARLPVDTRIEDERLLAETVATEEALAAMDDIAVELGTDQRVVDRMRIEYEKHLRVLWAHGDEADDNPGHRAEADFAALRLGLLTRKRETVVRMRDERRIDDTVLRQIQAQLDVEEVRLSRRDAAD